MPLPSPDIPLSGGRFAAEYHVSCDAGEIDALARELAVEQTVEFPITHVPPGDIRDQIVGRVESVEPLAGARHRVRISYAEEIVGDDVTQLLNVLFGNIAIKPGVRLSAIDVSPGLARAMGGPRLGSQGLRQRLGVNDRPLVCTAVKPMGLPPTALAEMAYTCALGGIDCIKDDHGLTDQSFAPFDQRVGRCAEAVQRANQSSGRKALYIANVTANGSQLLARARRAKQLGADGVLICPGIVGLGPIAELAADPSFDLPILAHPTLYGHFTGDPARGISHRALYGHLLRLAGADAAIFLSYGGRFPDSPQDCRDVIDGCRAPLAGLRPTLPVPGGGVTIERLPELLAFYGRETMFLVGGGLHTASDDLLANCRQLRAAVDQLLVP